jgi:hypothetical protein
MLKPSFSLKAHYDQLQTTVANLREAVVVTDAAAQALTSRGARCH